MLLLSLFFLDGSSVLLCCWCSRLCIFFVIPIFPLKWSIRSLGCQLNSNHFTDLFSGGCCPSQMSGCAVTHSLLPLVALWGIALTCIPLTSLCFPPLLPRVQREVNTFLRNTLTRYHSIILVIPFCSISSMSVANAHTSADTQTLS